MTALEFVKDPVTKESDPVLTANVLDEAKNNGVLFAKAGETGNIVRIVGPLCLNEKDAEKVVQVLDHAVSKHSKWLMGENIWMWSRIYNVYFVYCGKCIVI